MVLTRLLVALAFVARLFSIGKRHAEDYDSSYEDGHVQMHDGFGGQMDSGECLDGEDLFEMSSGLDMGGEQFSTEPSWGQFITIDVDV